MLSPGKWHLEVPTGYVANLRYRQAIFKACKKRPEFRKAVLYACKRDIFFWIRVFVWQSNPRKVGKEVEPFVDWEFQVGLIRKILDSIECHCHQDPMAHQHDLVIEKSREMGATWVCLIVALWLGLFHTNKQVLMISRNEEAVFGKSSDSLFWKIEFMLKHFPKWLTGEVRQLKRSFTFNRTRSSITGEASTGKAGVGGRATLMFIDEFSQIDEAEDILGRTSDTTGCRIFNGTHLGTGTAFYKLTRREDMPKLILHWTQHPAKRRGLYTVDGNRTVEVLDKVHRFPVEYAFNLTGAPTGGPFPGLRSPWYDWQCSRKMDSRKVAMDLDIDPQGSKSQFFDPLQVNALIKSYAVSPYWTATLEYDRYTGKPVKFVKDRTGKFKLWIVPDANGQIPFGRYSFGTDVSNGTGATPSCLAGMNERGEQVLEYAYADVGPDEFAPLSVAVCRMFRDYDGETARLAWECVGPGVRYGKKVVELGYRNIYYRTNDLALIADRTDTPGWFPTPAAKRLLLEEFRAGMYGHELLIRSKDVLQETLAFVYTNIGKIDHDRQHLEDDPAGSGENHGDRVMAAALMWRVGRERRVGLVEQEKTEVKMGTLAWRRQLADRERAEQLAWA